MQAAGGSTTGASILYTVKADIEQYIHDEQVVFMYGSGACSDKLSA
jgi:hypothetical protein